MPKYDHKKIESKWQKKWEKSKIFAAGPVGLEARREVKEDSKKKKFYCLDMFPYPSAEGLHVGHPEGYTASDIIVRKKIMDGYNVLHPFGWDAFGLPAENYAIKHKVHPLKSTAKNIEKMKRQVKSLGFAYDWSREINTTDPNYYKWTQWIFLKMWENGLAYEAEVPINFCPSCKTGLANEEVIDGKCERCKTEVEKKKMKQWMLRITKYAERLLQDLEKLDWPEKIKEMQRNWIGKSEGVEINFHGAKCDIECPQKNICGLTCEEYSIAVFTTRIDTIFGATFLILSPEHPLVPVLTSPEHIDNVRAYVEEVKNKTEIERTSVLREKTGVAIGASAVNPFTGEKISIFISDYVLSGYGTGAIMGVPAHDWRDWDFAKKYGLQIKPVIMSSDDTWLDSKTGKTKKFSVEDVNNKLVVSTLGASLIEQGADEGDGILVNSGEFNGLTSGDAKVKLADYAESKGWGKRQINYHLRDWVFSRQRYWGEPIPLIHCENCGIVAVPEKELPVLLPDVKKYEPTGTGESPLATIEKWVNVKCPKCGGKARRETNTMPQWAGSCWYYLAYIMRGNPTFTQPFHIGTTLKGGLQKIVGVLPLGRRQSTETTPTPLLIWDREKIDYWMPADLYIGGAEHAVLHLLYARFWYKFLYDLKLVPQDEPFLKLKNQGIILGEDGVKMSKSRGNVINPDDIVSQYGADTLRLYEMFMGEFSEAKPWNTKSIIGIRRFLERVWNFQDKILNQQPTTNNQQLNKLAHKTIKGVSEDIEAFKFNTAISKLMIYSNALAGLEEIPVELYKTLVILLSPFAPHLCEEIWEKLNKKYSLSDVEGSIVKQKWPEYDLALVKDDEIELIVQINGKLRDTIKVLADILEEDAKKIALGSEKIKKWLEGKEIKKIIFVQNKIINIVI